MKAKLRNGKFLTSDGEESHFSGVEFACRCGRCPWSDPKKVPVHQDLIDFLEDKIRGHYNRPVALLSGARCEAHNKSIGGSSRSLHVPEFHGGLCHASDIGVRGVEPYKVHDHALREMGPEMGGAGHGKTRCHVDVRPDPASWRYT